MPRTRLSVREIRSIEAKALGQKLAFARTEAGLTQLAAARALGIPQSQIAKLELGGRQLRFVEGLRLAAVYGIGPKDLQVGEDLASTPETDGANAPVSSR